MPAADNFEPDRRKNRPSPLAPDTGGHIAPPPMLSSSTSWSDLEYASSTTSGTAWTYPSSGIVSPCSEDAASEDSDLLLQLAHLQTGHSPQQTPESPKEPRQTMQDIATSVDPTPLPKDENASSGFLSWLTSALTTLPDSSDDTLPTTRRSSSSDTRFWDDDSTLTLATALPRSGSKMSHGNAQDHAAPAAIEGPPLEMPGTTSAVVASPTLFLASALSSLWNTVSQTALSSPTMGDAEDDEYPTSRRDHMEMDGLDTLGTRLGLYAL